MTDGARALDYLSGRGEYATHKPARPELILLDLRLPKVDGLEVLRQIKESSELKSIPVVILTTSAAEADVARAYDSHANGYLTKPSDLEEYYEIARSVTEFWTGVAVLPRLQGPAPLERD